MAKVVQIKLFVGTTFQLEFEIEIPKGWVQINTNMHKPLGVKPGDRYINCIELMKKNSKQIWDTVTTKQLKWTSVCFLVLIRRKKK